MDNMNDTFYSFIIHIYIGGGRLWILNATKRSAQRQVCFRHENI